MDILTLKKWWIGKKVISVSNAFQHDPENPSLEIGTVLDVVSITASGTPVPMVQYEGDPEPKIAFSTIMPYSDDLWAAVTKLTPAERWAFVFGVAYRFSKGR